MNDTSSPKSKWSYKRIALVFAVFVGILWFAGSDNVSAKLEKICETEARIIIYDPILWKEYEATVKKQYLTKKKINPQAKLSLLDDVPGFEYIFEIDLRFFDPSEIERDDRVIAKDGEIVARIVNYSVGVPKFAHYQGLSCIIYNEELYATKELPYE